MVVPTDLLEQYGADAVRYWASSGRPGTDTAFDQQQMKIGRRLAIKLLNASKFTLGFGASDTSDTDVPYSGDHDASKVSEPLDRSMLDRLADLVDDATAAFERFDYARALERTESFFWWFTDNYLELVKARAYGEFGPQRADSARQALRLALSTMQRMFAPFLPFVTEEVWSWWHDDSVHTADWPQSDSLREAAGGIGAAASGVAADALSAVRRKKSENKRKLRTTVLSASFAASGPQLAMLDEVIDDVKAAGVIVSVAPGTVNDQSEISVNADLEPEPVG